MAIIDTVTSTSATDDVVAFIPVWVASGSPACAQNDVWHVIGSAQEEGSTSPGAISDDLSVIWNSTQIVETPVDITETLLRASLRGERNELTRLVMEASQAHKQKLERMSLRGARRGTTSSSADQTGDPNHVAGQENSHRMRTSAGFIPIMEEDQGTPSVARQFNVNKGSYDYEQFVDDMKNLMWYNEDTSEMWGFAGLDVMAYFDKLSVSGFAGGLTRINLAPSEDTDFGFKVRSLETSSGKLNLVRTPQLRGPYAGYMCAVDPRFIGMAEYAPDEYRTNLQANDAKRRKDEFFSDKGFYMTLVEKHGLFVFS